MKSIGCPPFPIATTTTRRPFRIAGPILALGLLAPALAGCPGYLDPNEFPADGGSIPIYMPPGSAVPPAAAPPAAAPPAAAPPAVAPPAVAPPAMTPPAVAPPAMVPPAAPPAMMPPPAVNLPPPSPCSQPAAIAELFKGKCTLCHSTLMKLGDLDLEAPGSKARVLNQPSKSCKGQTLATTDAVGVFIDKLTGQLQAGCGAPMPMIGGLPQLSMQEIDCVRDWFRGR
jgi:hypothetical protein